MNDESKSQSNESNDYSVYDSENDESSLGEDAKHMRGLFICVVFISVAVGNNHFVCYYKL